MKKLFIIAGNRAQYDDWCRRAVAACRYPDTYYFYVSGVDTLRGYSDPDGICIGTWQQRPDIQDILQQLSVACRSREKIIKLQSLRMMLNQTYVGGANYQNIWTAEVVK